MKKTNKLNPDNTRTLSRPVSLQDIAKYCGVSPSTVSVALRGKECVLPNTRERILDAAKLLGYDSAQNAAASRLRMNAPHHEFINQMVALGFPKDYYLSTYFNNLAWGIMEVLLAHDFVLVHVPFSFQEPDKLDILSLPPVFRRGEVDGLITYPDQHFEILVNNLRETSGFRERPIVCIMHPGPTTHSVLADEEQGAYYATRHLLKNGHRQIAQIAHPYFRTMPESESFVRRFNGIKRAFAEFGCNIDDSLYYLPLPSGWLDPTNLYDGALPSIIDKNKKEIVSVIDFFKNNPKITAVMGMNDASVIYLWHLLSDLGYSVPEDISLIGFDDTDSMLDNAGRNILTTIKIPLREIGRQAAQILISSLAQSNVMQKNIVLPVELVVRQSVRKV
jgi:DNA-binding LacI/PurR family transcriptional regulator